MRERHDDARSTVRRLAADSAAPSFMTDSSRERSLYLVLTVVIVIASALPRILDLGLRSLWLDEFSTWHVATLPFMESLRWAPEITIPPLYQVCVRIVSGGAATPIEELLRAPAVIAGVLFVPAMAWLALLIGGRWLSLAASILAALHPLSVEYSREARPYSMLALFCTLSSALWLKLLQRPRIGFMVAYVVAMTLALYSHFLAAPVLAAHAALLLSRRARSHSVVRTRGWIAIATCLVLANPLLIRTLLYGGVLHEALGWNPQPTPAIAWSLLGAAGYGSLWTVLLFIALIAAIGMIGRFIRLPDVSKARPQERRGITLLMLWLLFSTGALLAAAALGLPLVAARYILPATPPILLLPLVMLKRAHWSAPLIAALCFVAPSLPDSLAPPPAEPGLRELVQFLRSDEADDDLVVMAVAARSREFRELEHLGVEYYGPWDEDLPLSDVDDALGVLSTPRRVRIIVLLGDPLPIIRQSGRAIQAIPFQNKFVSQLLYPPYRLITLAPQNPTR